jgi:predicted RNA-binding Zn ribbon-like protein
MRFTGYMTRRHENPSRAGSLALNGGCDCFNFANTASGRGGRHQMEHLQEPRHLLEWAQRASVLPEPQLRQLKRTLDRGSAQNLQKLLREAVKLRETIHVIGSARAKGRAPPVQALQALSRLSAASLASASLAFDGRGLSWIWTRAPAEAALIGRLAQSAVSVFSGKDAAHIKQCAGEHCGWLFIDRSRNGSRRWCDMKVCGNRAKINRFRQRTQGPEK